MVTGTRCLRREAAAGRGEAGAGLGKEEGDEGKGGVAAACSLR